MPKNPKPGVIISIAQNTMPKMNSIAVIAFISVNSLTKLSPASANTAKKFIIVTPLVFVRLKQTDTAVLATVHRFHVARFFVDKQVEIVS